MRPMEITMIFVSAVVALLVSGLLGKFFVPFLRKVKYGQTIKEIGPSWHMSKQGTPTMGGIIFIIGMTVALIVTYGVYFFTGQGSVISLMLTTVQKLPADL